MPPRPVAVTAHNITRGEYFTWQLAIFVPPNAPRVENVSVTFVGMEQLNATCFNTGGINAQGFRFTTSLNIEANRVRSLWMGAQIPKDVDPGTVFNGTIVISAAGLKSRAIPVSLQVGSNPPPSVEPEPTRMTRLRWLNSELYTHDLGLVPPYTAIQRLGGGGAPMFGIATSRLG